MVSSTKFYHYLKSKRTALRLSQARLGSLVGVATSTICHIEAGAYTKFPLNKVLKLGQILGINQDQFALMWIDAIVEDQKETLKRKIFSAR